MSSYFHGEQSDEEFTRKKFNGAHNWRRCKVQKLSFPFEQIQKKNNDNDASHLGQATNSSATHEG